MLLVGAVNVMGALRWDRFICVWVISIGSNCGLA